MELKGKDYLVIVDCYSKFIETCPIRDKTAGTVIIRKKDLIKIKNFSLKCLILYDKSLNQNCQEKGLVVLLKSNYHCIVGKKSYIIAVR